MDTWIMDLECFPNYFLVGIYDYKNKKTITFEVSDQKDERIVLRNALMKFDGYLVGFNTLHYDEVLLKFLLKDWKMLKELSVAEFLQEMKRFSDKVIDSDVYFDDIKWYKWYKDVKWTSIDLYLYWSKMLRLSKKISLKTLAIQLNWDEIQELPYAPDHVLSDDEVTIVREYNTKNDLGITTKLFEEMKEEILLRNYIHKKFGLECWSMDAPKIAGEILIEDYCRKTFICEDTRVGTEIAFQEREFREYFREVKKKRFADYYGKIGDVMEGFNVDFEIPFFQEIKKRMYESDKSFSLEQPLIYGDTRMIMSYGIGGFHSLNKNEVYRSDDEHIIVTSDFASLYPNIIINWSCIRFEEVLTKYTEIKDDRMEAKRLKEKVRDKFNKLILNSTSGLLDNEYSPLRYSEGALRMRVAGQLIISKMMEIALLNGWRVISGNTDGMEAVIPRGEWEKYKKALGVCETLFNISLDHNQYESVAYSNVNNYIAKTIKGDVKKKGLFKYHSDIPLGDSVNEQIIPIALEKYFVDGISIDETIRNPWKYGIHIYDYCVSKKISKGTYDVMYYNRTTEKMEKVQNLNRYYFSKNAPLLFKVRKGRDKLEHVHKGQGVVIFNKFEEKKWEDYDIDFNYYTAKARKLINEIEQDVRQTSLF